MHPLKCYSNWQKRSFDNRKKWLFRTVAVSLLFWVNVRRGKKTKKTCTVFFMMSLCLVRLAESITFSLQLSQQAKKKVKDSSALQSNAITTQCRLSFNWTVTRVKTPAALPVTCLKIHGNVAASFPFFSHPSEFCMCRQTNVPRREVCSN